MTIMEHWRRGLLRLYVVAAVPWALWFGYAAYDAHTVYAFNRDYMSAFEKAPTNDWSFYHRAALHRDEFLSARNSNLLWMSFLPIGYPVAALSLLWVVAGFRRQ